MKNKKLINLLLLCLIFSGCSYKTYTVTFDTLGGSVINSVTLKEGETLNNIETPTKDGYLFVNWLKDGVKYNVENPINEDITLTASWTEKPVIKKEYTVSFVTDKYIEKIMVEENTSINEPEIPTKKDYVFLGWFNGNEKYDFNKKVTKDIVLTAKYKLDVVTVTYDLDGGIGIASQTISTNTSPSIPETPTKKGYRFLKWTLNGKEFSFNQKVSKDITIKAVWEKIEYVTVIFDTDGGNMIDNKIIERYSKINELPIPIKEGYLFKEWQLNNSIFDTESVVKDSITLKAVYELIENID